MTELLTVATGYENVDGPGWLDLCRLLAQPAIAAPSPGLQAPPDRQHAWLLRLRADLIAGDVEPADWFGHGNPCARRALAVARQACGLAAAENPPLLTPLERWLLDLHLSEGPLSTQAQGALEMVVMLIHSQSGGNESGRLAWLRLWRLDDAPPTGEFLARAPQALMLDLDAAFQHGLHKVDTLLRAALQPHGPPVAWALQPLPLLSDGSKPLPWGTQQLNGPSLSVALAVGCLHLLSARLQPACAAQRHLLWRLHPQALGITAQFAGDAPPAPNPLDWALAPIGGINDKLHAFGEHQLHPGASKNREHPMKLVWVAGGQKATGDRVRTREAKTLGALLELATGLPGEDLPPAAQALRQAVLQVQDEGVEELAALQPRSHLPRLPALPAAAVKDMRNAPWVKLSPQTPAALELHLLHRLAQWTGGEHLQFQHDTGLVNMAGVPVRLRDEFHAIAIDPDPNSREVQALRDQGKSEAAIRERFQARHLDDLLVDPRFGHPSAWVLSAPPAAGKTTLLAEFELRSCWRALHRFDRHGQWGEVALWVPLRQLRPLQGGVLPEDLTPVMDDWLQRHARAFGGSWEALFSGRLAREQGLSIRPLFDGVNELKCSPEQRQIFVQRLVDTWWPQARADRPTPVFTVRTLERGFTLINAGHAQLRPWGEDRRNTYIDERLGADSEQAHELKQAIADEKKSDGTETDDEHKFYASPGMLALVCNLLQRGWIAQATGNPAQLFACTLWMRLFDEMERTKGQPGESLRELLHPEREAAILVALEKRLDQHRWVPPAQPGPLLANLRDLARRMQWPVDANGCPKERTLGIAEEDVTAVGMEPARLLRAAEALHLLVREESDDPQQAGATRIEWRWAHQRWAEWWAAYGLTPDQPPADLSIPPGADLQALYRDFLARQQARRQRALENEGADPADDEDDEGDEDFRLPEAPPINDNEEIVAMAVQLRGQAVRWVRVLLERGNAELAARVALENWAAFGERRKYPLDAWQPKGQQDSEDGPVQPGSGTHPDLNCLRAALLERMKDPQVHISSRLRSGMLLGDLGGDGRFQVCGQALILKDKHWQRVGQPGGEVEVLMGDLEGEKDERTAEGGLLSVSIPAFEMAGLMTTNAQMRCFVESEGHDNPCWWPAEAGEWFKRHNEDRPWTLSESDFSNGSQPFGCVYWQVQAYALWESAQRQAQARVAVMASQRQETRTAQRVSLPTEASWEAAARSCQPTAAQPRWRFGRRQGLWDPEQQRFTDVEPWHFNHDYVVARASPVGAFVESAVGELQDMAGNLWEWTSSARTEFLELEAIKTPVTGHGLRALRGGSYNNPARHCAAGARFGSSPGSVSFDYGFRLVRVVCE